MKPDSPRKKGFCFIDLFNRTFRHKRFYDLSLHLYNFVIHQVHLLDTLRSTLQQKLQTLPFADAFAGPLTNK
ncbi:hypothetical protein MA16_Dca015681 [Dendrobium catenatum]|uniref:Uncharacterized protein n=1 Tax=Dendrobium catenatum TaxID=906689 RepID=A0A2I0V8E4_9ASPA|nr:hypothetical protein MA16_Dca015681 [Dendrobium catenatum]